MTDEAARRRGARFWLAVALFPVAMVILLSLGTWQVQRLYWKEALIAEIETRRTAVPMEIADVEAKVAVGEDVDYWAMRASGRFLHDKERHFLATYDGQAGFYVYTPLQLADGRYLFVNRGFVPYSDKAQQTRTAGLVEGEQQVTGLARARLYAKPGSLVPDNDPITNIFYWKDLGAMAATVDLPSENVLPFFLDADATPVPGGLPKGGVTQIDLPNNHLQYAVTWYGLALALAGVAIAAFVRRRV